MWSKKIMDTFRRPVTSEYCTFLRVFAESTFCSQNTFIRVPVSKTTVAPSVGLRPKSLPHTVFSHCDFVDFTETESWRTQKHYLVILPSILIFEVSHPA